MDIVRPNVVFRIWPPHGGPLFYWVGELGYQLVTTDAGPRQFSFSAQRLGIADDLATIPLPAVVTPAADHTGTLSRKQFRVDDKSALTGVGNVLRAGSVAIFAADIDLVHLRIVVDIDGAIDVVNGPG